MAMWVTNQHVITDGNTLDKCASNKTHNKNIKNIHALRTITYPGSHSPPSYVASSRDARTAHAITIYGTAHYSIPMAVLNQTYTVYTQQYKITCTVHPHNALMHCTMHVTLYMSIVCPHAGGNGMYICEQV